jgi:RNA exonuclease 1
VSEPPVTVPTTSALSIEAAASVLNERLIRLYDALPPRTAFIVFSGHSDPRTMTALNAKKALFENALRSGKSFNEINSDTGGCSWTMQDGRALEEAVENAKRGLLFLSVKDAK